MIDCVLVTAADGDARAQDLTQLRRDLVIRPRDGDRLMAAAPKRIAGLIEVRGLGIVSMHASDPAPLALIVEIGEEERMPEPHSETIEAAEPP